MIKLAEKTPKLEKSAVMSEEEHEDGGRGEQLQILYQGGKKNGRWGEHFRGICNIIVFPFFKN